MMAERTQDQEAAGRDPGHQRVYIRRRIIPQGRVDQEAAGRDPDHQRANSASLPEIQAKARRLA